MRGQGKILINVDAGDSDGDLDVTILMVKAAMRAKNLFFSKIETTCI